ncbi:hypothetical protein ES703_46260 [subsurface metagenome]
MEKKKKEIPELEKLRSFKERSSWSYQKISNHMGIHSQTIYFWLSGKYNPSSLALEKIRRFLDVYAY